MQDTRPLLVKQSTDFPSIKRAALEILQVNLGYLCNLSCTHCHVNAGPKRTEKMDEETVGLVLKALQSTRAKTLDLTGGAPEMNAHFRNLVVSARQMGVEVIDRCNLTIFEEEGFADLPEFLAAQGVRVVASMPCYSEKNVDLQRGKGVFEKSIRGLQKLNQLGYGKDSTGLVLDLVYNPGGAFLPPGQEQLEADYKAELSNEFDIVFNQLLTLANMPIARFGAVLTSKGEFDNYMQLLRDNYSEDNLASVMCRSTLSVDWQGYCYDCDFNQMLNLPLADEGNKTHLRELLEHNFIGDSIAIADHCFGCTAGQGSSCGGALS